MSPASASFPAGVPVFQNTSTEKAKKCAPGALAGGAAAGAIALCERGSWWSVSVSVLDQVDEAARAGAVAVVIYDTDSSETVSMVIPVRARPPGGPLGCDTRRTARAARCAARRDVCGGRGPLVQQPPLYP
jgi:hypothetical protein